MAPQKKSNKLGKMEKVKNIYDSNSVEATITAKDLRMTSSHETKYRLTCSETDLKINSNMHDLREVQDFQTDKDNSGHKEGAMTGETLPELKRH